MLVFNQEPIINYLLPVLLSKVKNNSGGDTKFLSLKTFTDILIQYLNEDTVYSSPTSSASAN